MNTSPFAEFEAAAANPAIEEKPYLELQEILKGRTAAFTAHFDALEQLAEQCGENGEACLSTHRINSLRREYLDELYTWACNRMRTLLLQGRTVEIPSDFVLEALRVTDPQAALKKWDHGKIVSWFHRRFQDLDEAEWDEYRSRIFGCHFRNEPGECDELALYCRLFEKSWNGKGYGLRIGGESQNLRDVLAFLIALDLGQRPSQVPLPYIPYVNRSHGVRDAIESKDLFRKHELHCAQVVWLRFYVGGEVRLKVRPDVMEKFREEYRRYQKRK